ncbi:FYVE zinc finger domain-containing protein [Piscirickettsia litoralis]|uniref:FYVE zinc finger domain-containing protein n=1 Tax=Piscirickettsia litoralis TaxID=1891921 RepID=UPI000980DE23|nr:FYVE zinc finger domain-containing protein [Piscirickettsia litoralis]
MIKEAEHRIKKYQLCIAKPPSPDREFEILTDLWSKCYDFRMKNNKFKPDNSRSDCSICNEEFKLFFRRHHCRYCGNLICSDCSHTSKTSLDLIKNKQYRICSE